MRFTYLLYGNLEQYQSETGWKDFNMEERASTGVNDMEAGKIVVAYYSIMGVPLQKEPYIW